MGNNDPAETAAGRNMKEPVLSPLRNTLPDNEE
jgi:hypothetical protein